MSAPPDPVPSAAAQELGQYIVDELEKTGFAGFKIANAVETVLPDTRVLDVYLTSEASAKGTLLVTIFRVTSEPLLGPSDTLDPVEEAALDAQAKAIGLSTEDISIPGASKASLTMGPFASRCQLVVRLENGMVINICSSTGQLKGSDLPLNRAGVEKLASLLLVRAK